ncbi:MAG: helix-turn-helix domain-containing protein [Desulfarculales bacterium]|nr:helix-turn-helix domain-containing protein [Desulfarculales bacterium]
MAHRRRAVGLTQDKLAEKLSISGASLSRIESGLAAPRFPRLEDLAEILGCQVRICSEKRAIP